MIRARILAIASLLLFATGVQAACPPKQFSFDCHQTCGMTSTTPTGSMIFPSIINPYCHVDPWQAGTPCPIACYDMPHGRVEAHFAPGGTSRCSNSVAVRDTFALDGPEGPPVSFEAVLLVQCSIVYEGSAWAVVGTADPIHRNYNTNGNYELVLPLSVVPGSRFELYYGVSATNTSPAETTGRSGSDIIGDLRFRGLPPGHVLITCSNLLAPVPATATSWGSVKSHYR